VAAKYILATLAVLFFVLAIGRMTKGGGAAHPQTRTWLLIAVIFTAVSAWLWWQT
jgi:hypothetical protein